MFKHRAVIWFFGGVILLTCLYIVYQYREHSLSERQLWPVRFEHRDHTDTNCVECHHNFIDDTGQGSCYACHKFTTEIAADMEKMFHDFCRDCHIKTQIKRSTDMTLQADSIKTTKSIKPAHPIKPAMKQKTHDLKQPPARSCSDCHNDRPSFG